MSDIQAINDAWHAETSRRPHPAADAAIQAALIPAGGKWECTASNGAITRSIVWRGIEVALVNPRGDLDDVIEGQIAMGFRAAPVMDKALRVIFMLSQQPNTSDRIGKIARAAIDYVEQPAPPISDPDDGSTEETEP
jgi:hypothetical protein